ncbi:MAG: dicarboxylate/amino acid:cation symporter [Legionellales bacterium]|nr:dicarboxylate/amino acid:cation symporter [Legionellales bacterium]
MVKKSFTSRILVGLICGFLLGILLRYFGISADWLVYELMGTVGELFMRGLVMIVVPVIFVSVLCGVGTLSDLGKVGQMGTTAFGLYIFTTAIAITIALTVATWFGIGRGVDLGSVSSISYQVSPLSFQELLLSWVPTNPFLAFVEGDFIQLIILAVLFGIAIIASGQPGKRIIRFFSDINSVLTSSIMIIMSFAPVGIFCLITKLTYSTGGDVLGELLAYVLTVFFVLLLQVVLVYGIILKLFTPYTIQSFLKKMASTMLFAFSTSSSNASIPVVLRTVKEQFHVKRSVAQFVIPLGATVNMDGTAIMQGIATVFITNAYGFDLSLSDYLTVIMMATIASIGTAGVPSVGFITLTMVLNQIGVPADGIAILFGVDRIIDMARTAVNVSGDAMVSVVVNERYMEPTADREEHFQAREKNIPYNKTNQYKRKKGSARTLRSAVKNRR